MLEKKKQKQSKKRKMMWETYGGTMRWFIKGSLIQFQFQVPEVFHGLEIFEDSQRLSLVGLYVYLALVHELYS